MADRKAVIKNADMSEDMQQDAVDCASQALEKYNIEKDIAAFIKKVSTRNARRRSPPKLLAPSHRRRSRSTRGHRTPRFMRTRGS